jgi:EmrB/QacA subfamily drug resistance transporter
MESSRSVALQAAGPAIVTTSAQRRVLVAVTFGASLTSLDAGAVTAVLPFVRSAFHADIASVHWVLTAELLVTSGLLLILGRLGDHLGYRRLFLTGFVIFLAACTLCAAASTLTWLIAFRACQGIGSAMLLSNSPALLTRHMPAARLGSGFGTKLSGIYLGLIAGTAAGGWLAGLFGWRAIFWMDFIIGAFAFALAIRFLPNDELPARRSRYGLAGAAVWIGGLAIFVWLLHQHGSRNIARAGIVATVVVLLLLAEQFTGKGHAPDSLLDLSCLRSRRFGISAMSLMLAFSASYILTFVLAFYLVQVRHETPAITGQVLAVYALARAFGAYLSGRLSDRMDARILTISGLLLLAFGLMKLATLTNSSPISGLIATVSSAGAGFGCFVAPNNRLLMRSAPPERYGAAAGLMATSRTLGMTIGIAIAQAILSVGANPVIARAGLAFGTAAIVALVAVPFSLLTEPKTDPRHRQRMGGLRELR